MIALLVAVGIMVPQCEIVVTTWSGDEYVVGSGDTCKDAVLIMSEVPDDWREMVTRQGYVVNW